MCEGIATQQDLDKLAHRIDLQLRDLQTELKLHRLAVFYPILKDLFA